MSITKTVNLVMQYDTLIDSYHPTTNYNTATTGMIGRAASNDEIHRGLFKVDFSSISAISFNTVKLYLYLHTSGVTANRTLEGFRVLKNWVSAQTTWNIYSTGNNWTAAGLQSGTDYNATSLGSGTIVLDYEGWIYLTLSATEMYKICDGTYSNYGVFVKQSYEGVGEDSNFYFTGGTYPPYLYVSYEEPDGGDQICNGFIQSKIFRGVKNILGTFEMKNGLLQPSALKA